MTSTQAIGEPVPKRRSVVPVLPLPSAFAREGAVSILWGLGVYAVSLLTGPMLARSLGPDGRGALAAVVAPGQVLVHLLGVGVPSACAYFAHLHDRRHLVGAAVVTSTLVAAPIALALWPFVPRYLDGYDPAAVVALRALLLQTVVTILALTAIELRRAQAADLAFNVLRSLAVLLNAACTLALFVSGHLTLGAAMVSAVGSVIVADLVALHAGRLAWPAVRWPVVRAVWGFGARGWLGTLSNTMTARLDQILLVGMASPSQLGRYAVAVSAANVTVPIGQGAASAVLPQLRRGGLSTPADLRRAVLAVGAAAALVAGTVAATAPMVLPALFGESFRGAVTPLLVLLPGQVAAAVGEVLRADLGSRGRPGQASVCHGVAGAVTLALIVPAVHLHGIVGAAAVTTTAYVALAITAATLDLRSRRPSAADRG